MTKFAPTQENGSSLTSVSQTMRVAADCFLRMNRLLTCSSVRPFTGFAGLFLFRAVNLLIEAPLSVAFDHRGNPIGRSVEKQNSNTRYWYVGLGCAVMVAALYLIKAVIQAKPNADIRLFEGFVSYKESKKKTGHCQDVLLLREVVDNPDRYSDAIFLSDSLKMDHTDTPNSAFMVAGVDAGIPPIIMRNG